MTRYNICIDMHKYIITKSEQITPTTLLLSMRVDQQGPPFSFQPGQYAAINYYKGIRPSAARCFSIVSSPTDQEILQFSMRTKGRYTKALARLKEGDIVKVRGPFGGFVLDTKRDTRAILLAGGIGITPFMSMVRYAAATSAMNQIDLIYSCQTQDDIPFANELIELEKNNPNFKVTFVIAEGAVDKLASAHTASGRISGDILSSIVGDVHEFAAPTFFICGPPPFMKGMSKLLRDKGAQRTHIMTEAFSQGPLRQTGKVKNWPLNMYILTAFGVGVGSFVVMLVDLLKTLPPSSVFSSSSSLKSSTLKSARQTDLDALVNSIQPTSSTAPESDAVKSAIAAAAVQPTTKKSQKTSTTTPSTTTSTSTQSTTTPTPVIATPVVPPKKCTTQSGLPC